MQDKDNFYLCSITSKATVRDSTPAALLLIAGLWWLVLQGRCKGVG